MRVWHDLLATPGSLARSRCLATAPRTIARSLAPSGSHRLVEGCRRQCHGESSAGRQKTGPNPTDRGKCGSKHHVMTDASGIPLAITLTAANVHDIKQLLPLLVNITPVRGKRGRPRQRPDTLIADKAYDSQPLRDTLRWLGIEPKIPRRRQSSAGLGKLRWVVERTLAWLHQLRRLRTRYDRRDDVHQAFMNLGCAMICWKQLK